MTTREAVQLALEAIISNGRGWKYEDELEAIAILRAELAKPEPELISFSDDARTTAESLVRKYYEDEP